MVNEQLYRRENSKTICSGTCDNFPGDNIMECVSENYYNIKVHIESRSRLALILNISNHTVAIERS